MERSASMQSNSNLGNQMKLLNEKKQFRKALDLFDKHSKNNTETLSSLVITQALKACAHLKDLHRGSAIHELVSSRAYDDAFISTSIIHLYSKSREAAVFLIFSIVVQCGNVARAQSLFDKASKKTVSMYGAMMKG